MRHSSRSKIILKAVKILTDEQEEIFLPSADQDPIWRDLCYTKLTTCLWLGDICGLMWNDFNELKGDFSVIRTLYKNGGRLVAGDTKTYAGTRNILLPSSTAERWTGWKKWSYSPWIFPNLLWPEAPLNSSTAYHQLKKILTAVALPAIKSHDLRHTFATLSLQSGVDVKTLSSTLGHYSAGSTLDIYTHATQRMRQKAADFIGQAM